MEGSTIEDIASSAAAKAVAGRDPRVDQVQSVARPCRVSVVIPTKDRSALLIEAIRSVRAVEGPDLELEIIVVDNGSSDDTQTVARALGTRLLQASAPGPAAARNVGIRAATGDFIAFLDDDDLWLPGHLRPQLALLAERPDLSACMGQIIPISASGEALDEPYPSSLPDDGDVFESFLTHWPQIGALVVRASVRDSVGYLDERLVAAEDWDWLLRIAQRHRVGHVAVPGVLFRSRPVATASEDQTALLRVPVTRRVFWRNVWRARHRRLPMVRIIRAALRFDGVYAGYFIRSATTHAEAGNSAAALRSLTRAVGISPLHVVSATVRKPSSFAWIAPALRRVLGQATEQCRGRGRHS